MRNRNVSALLTLGAAAVFLLAVVPAAEAELICKKFKPSGPKVCYESTTGSVNCLAIAQGVAGKLAKDCDTTTGEDCFIVVTCSIFGTEPPYEELDEDYCGFDDITGQFPGGTNCYPGTPPIVPNCNEGCLIEGEARCLNPNLHYEEHGTAYLGGPLTSASATATCDSGGTCTSTATVTGGSGEGICPNSNWTLDFTPYSFFGELSFCPGGFVATGEFCTDCNYDQQPEMECCANNKRNSDGSCFKPFQDGQPTEGQPGFIRTMCGLPAYCYDNGNPTDACFEDGHIKEGVPYDCSEI